LLADAAARRPLLREFVDEARFDSVHAALRRVDGAALLIDSWHGPADAVRELIVEEVVSDARARGFGRIVAVVNAVRRQFLTTSGFALSPNGAVAVMNVD